MLLQVIIIACCIGAMTTGVVYVVIKVSDKSHEKVDKVEKPADDLQQFLNTKR